MSPPCFFQNHFSKIIFPKCFFSKIIFPKLILEKMWGSDPAPTGARIFPNWRWESGFGKFSQINFGKWVGPHPQGGSNFPKLILDNFPKFELPIPNSQFPPVCLYTSTPVGIGNWEFEFRQFPKLIWEKCGPHPQGAHNFQN